jgi:RNA-directed DNA polymerase
VLEGDIRACFDELSHDWLLAHSPMDKAILRKGLKAGYMEGPVLHPTDAGTPQGGICSPILANLALDGLEGRLRPTFPRYVWKGSKRTCPQVNRIRRADDVVITGATQELLAHEVKPLGEAFLRARGLTLSPEKTVMTPIADGFDFLGQHLRNYNGKLRITPSATSITSMLRNGRAVIKGHKSAAAGTFICHLNPIMRGWAMDHRQAVSANAFQSVDHAIFQAPGRWAQRRHPHKGVQGVKARYWHTVGERHWVFSGKARGQKGSLRVVHLCTAHSVPSQRHTKINGEATPDDPQWEPYCETRLALKMAASLKGRRPWLTLW